MGKLISPFLPCVHFTTCGQMDMSPRELVKGRTSTVYGFANSSSHSGIESKQAHTNTPIALAIAETEKPPQLGKGVSYGTTDNINYKYKAGV